MVLNFEIHKKVFIYVDLQFKSEFKENYLALTSLKIPLTMILKRLYMYNGYQPNIEVIVLVWHNMLDKLSLYAQCGYELQSVREKIVLPY